MGHYFLDRRYINERRFAFQFKNLLCPRVCLPKHVEHSRNVLYFVSYFAFLWEYFSCCKLWPKDVKGKRANITALSLYLVWRIESVFFTYKLVGSRKIIESGSICCTRRKIVRSALHGHLCGLLACKNIKTCIFCHLFVALPRVARQASRFFCFFDLGFNISWVRLLDSVLSASSSGPSNFFSALAPFVSCVKWFGMYLVLFAL